MHQRRPDTFTQQRRKLLTFRQPLMDG
jgi:hypothetical protein